MSIDEIIALVPCRACAAKVGFICMDSQGIAFFEAVHDVRREDAVRERERREEIKSAGGRDCAWCGIPGIASPRPRFGVTWDLCARCVTDPVCAEGQAMEGKREEERKQRRARIDYPQQTYPMVKPEEASWRDWDPKVRPLTPVEMTEWCPMCKAAKGLPCISSRGTIRLTPHKAREPLRKPKVTEVTTPWMMFPLEEEARARDIAREIEAGKWKVNAEWVPTGPPPARPWDPPPVQKPQEKSEGGSIELKPLVGIWHPRIIDGFLVEGMDWPWVVGQGMGEIRVYYTLTERKLWVASIALDKNSPGGLSREFWPRGRGVFVAQVLRQRLFHPVEVAADHRNGGPRLRWYGVVQAITLTANDGVADIVSAPSAVEAIDLAQWMKNPELKLSKPERRFNFEQ